MKTPVVLGMTILLTIPTIAAGQKSATPRSTLAGVYSEQQATRGQDV